ncbi:hypothetical protein [Methanolobus sp.]|uniref:hypothetical protein n=1 Tax=Methanolobus sp. TaxID=1874737 RepID=UPI0025F5EB13|nr:hypothetical protein [Methanolobus sp.]
MFIQNKVCPLYCFLAGIFEIIGAYLVWMWLRENKDVSIGICCIIEMDAAY